MTLNLRYCGGLRIHTVDIRIDGGHKGELSFGLLRSITVMVVWWITPRVSTVVVIFWWTILEKGQRYDYFLEDILEEEYRHGCPPVVYIPQKIRLRKVV